MKYVFCGFVLYAAIFVICPKNVRAWGGGHDNLARVVAARLPEPWKTLLQEPKTLSQFVRDNHYPDSFEPIDAGRTGDWAMRFLESMNISKRYDFHSDKGRSVAFSLLVEAIRADEPDRVFFWLAVLMHSTADMAACNHDPLVHSATYIWGEKDWKLDVPLKNEGCADLAWIEKFTWAKKIFENDVDARLMFDDGAEAGESLLRIMLYGFEGVDACSPHGRTIVEDGSRWATTKDREAGERVATALSKLGSWAAVRTIRDFQAAIRLAETDDFARYDESLQKEFDKRARILLSNRSLDNDSMARGLLLGVPTLPSVAVLYEPAWRMNEGAFGFGDRVVACQVVGSLRSFARPAGLIDVKAFQQDGISDATKIPLLIVPATSFNSYRIVDRKILCQKMNDYLERGGRILWIGGNKPPAEVFPELSGAINRMSDENRSGSWPLPEGDFFKAKIQFDPGDTEQTEWSFVRLPKGQAGWSWPRNPCCFEKEEPEQFRHLLKLKNGAHTRSIGAAFPVEDPRVLFLPSYAVFPYILTPEAPQYAPLVLKLDSAGDFLLERSIHILSCPLRESSVQK